MKKPFCFSKIGFDIAHYDIHPPLYFWILHVWILIVGVHTWSGPVLNILISMINIIILFGFAKYILDNSKDAIYVAYTYALSPAVIFTSLDARQYDLFALFTIIFTWQIIKFLNLIMVYNCPTFKILYEDFSFSDITY